MHIYTTTHNVTHSPSHKHNYSTTATDHYSNRRSNDKLDTGAIVLSVNDTDYHA